MSWQSLRHIMPTLLIMLTSCTSSRSVEFLGFDGCPNTPILRERLQEAAGEERVVEVDLMTLKTGDARLGWGAPSILVDGKDLFGVPASKNGSVSCRNWNDGLPTVDEIKQAMRNPAQ